MGKKKPDLHESLIVVAEEDVELLSYKGQMLWNKLAKETEARLKLQKKIKGVL